MENVGERGKTDTKRDIYLIITAGWQTFQHPQKHEVSMQYDI